MFIFNKKIEPPKNIIIARTDKIGDLVLSIPAISMVKRMYPASNLYVLVRQYNADIIKGFSFIKEVIAIDKYDEKDLIDKIKQIKADVFISLYSNNHILKLALKSNAKYRIGPLSKPLSWFIYNKGIKQHRSKSIKNEAEYNLDLIRKLDKNIFDSKSIVVDKIIYNETDSKKVQTYLHENNIHSYILIHPFSGGSTKNLTINEYVTLINKIQKKLPNMNIVISSAEDNIKDANYIINTCSNIYLYLSQSILELAALIDMSSLYIGSSTGPSHIAGNLSKKCVCIYPAYKVLSSTRWGLYGNEKNTIYIVPDKDNMEKDYKSKVFANINNNVIEEIAEKVHNMVHNI